MGRRHGQVRAVFFAAGLWLLVFSAGAGTAYAVCGDGVCETAEDPLICEADCLFGDVNNDGNVSSIDASQTARHAVGLITLDAGAQARAEVSDDGNISSIDASQIARRTVGLISAFPIQTVVAEGGYRFEWATDYQSFLDVSDNSGLELNPAEDRVYVTHLSTPSDGIATYTDQGAHVDLQSGLGAVQNMVGGPPGYMNYGTGISAGGTDCSVLPLGTTCSLTSQLQLRRMSMADYSVNDTYTFSDSASGQCQRTCTNPIPSNPPQCGGYYYYCDAAAADFNYTSMAMASDQTFYMYFHQLGWMEKFDGSGNSLGVVGFAGTGDGQFGAPKGMAVDDQDRLYVADTQNDRVQVLDAAGTFIRKWGTAGTAPGEFADPMDVAVDDQGLVYVADYNNNRVQLFDANGIFVTAWGWNICANPLSCVPADGEFDGPARVAVDANQCVYVLDAGFDRIQKFCPYYDNGKNDPPRLRLPADPTISVAAGTWSAEIIATDPDVGDSVASYATGALPTGATFNAGTRTFFWDPAPGQEGSYEVPFAATDTYGLTSYRSLYITVQ